MFNSQVTGTKPLQVQCMAKPAQDEVRKLFTEIGCIMEDASLIALVWSSTDNLDVRARYRTISEVHEKIGELLLQIDSAS